MFGLGLESSALPKLAAVAVAAEAATLFSRPPSFVYGSTGSCSPLLVL